MCAYYQVKYCEPRRRGRSQRPKLDKKPTQRIKPFFRKLIGNGKAPVLEIPDQSFSELSAKFPRHKKNDLTNFRKVILIKRGLGKLS
jgi:hypothetical protein